jgi:carbonic anhydrase/acetyltransferase-like protein (isoleucine patch superfamily)
VSVQARIPGPGEPPRCNVTVGDGSFIGIGSVVRERASIGVECTLSAGSVVLGDLPDRALAVGCPGDGPRIE